MESFGENELKFFERYRKYADAIALLKDKVIALFNSDKEFAKKFITKCSIEEMYERTDGCIYLKLSFPNKFYEFKDDELWLKNEIFDSKFPLSSDSNSYNFKFTDQEFKEAIVTNPDFASEVVSYHLDNGFALRNFKRFDLDSFQERYEGAKKIINSHIYLESVGKTKGNLDERLEAFKAERKEDRRYRREHKI